MKLRHLAALAAGSLVATLVATLAPTAVAAPAPGRSSAPAALVAGSAASAVEPGSYLAVVDSGPDADYGGVDPKSQRLVLISPTGATRTVYTRKVEKFRTFTLADWSTDGSTALLVGFKRKGGDLIRVDVATGATQVLDVPLLNSALLDPAGTGVFATAWKGPRSNILVLDRISWSGAVTRLRENSSGMMVAGPGGTVLTSDSDQGRVQLLLSAATGAVVNRFRAAGYCTPIRWWDATHLLETCKQGDLYLVDPVAGTADRLTGDHGRGDYGHLDARYVGSRLYVQVGGACGYTYVARVTHGTTKPLKVPGAVGSVVMVNAVGSNLVIEHAASCDGDRPRSVLSLFDPVQRDETVLLQLGRHEDFGVVRVLGEVRASTY